MIYNDLDKLAWLPQTLETYHPTPHLYQVLALHNGNFAMKYLMGLSLLREVGLGRFWSAPAGGDFAKWRGKKATACRLENGICRKGAWNWVAFYFKIPVEMAVGEVRIGAEATGEQAVL